MGVLTRIRAGVDALANDIPVGRTSPQSDNVHLSAAIEWLRCSQDVTADGGSAATYNLVLGWADSYPETTGYIIPTLFSYASLRDEPEVADRAVRMANWLCAIQHPAGSFPSGTGENGDPNVFNTGQIVLGLVAAYRETGDSHYRTAVRDACDWLVTQQTDDGCWTEHDYRNETHAYTTRVAWALLEGADIVSEESNKYRESARRNLRWAVTLQQPNGWFNRAGFEPDQTPYLHTIAYTVRGLLEGGSILDDADYLAAAERTAEKLLSIQRTDGILKGAYNESWCPSWYYCLTGNAQMAAIWFRLFDQTGKTDYRDEALRTVDFLKRRQILSGASPIRGALAGSYPLVGRYMYLRYPNWATKFFIDALLMAQDQSSQRRGQVSSPARTSRLR